MGHRAKADPTKFTRVAAELAARRLRDISHDVDEPWLRQRSQVRQVRASPHRKTKPTQPNSDKLRVSHVPCSCRTAGNRVLVVRWSSQDEKARRDSRGIDGCLRREGPEGQRRAVE